MTQRGRKSAGDLTAVLPGPMEKPKPLPELTEAESEKWNQVVSSLRADWFNKGDLALLAQYCRHWVCCDESAKRIQAFRESFSDDMKQLDLLQKMQDRETRLLMSLGTKLRITPQTRYDKSRKPADKPKPAWAS